MRSISPHHLNIILNKHALLLLGTYQHGVNAYVRTSSSNTSTSNKMNDSSTNGLDLLPSARRCHKSIKPKHDFLAFSICIPTKGLLTNRHEQCNCERSCLEYNFGIGWQFGGWQRKQRKRRNAGKRQYILLSPPTRLPYPLPTSSPLRRRERYIAR